MVTVVFGLTSCALVISATTTTASKTPIALKALARRINASPSKIKKDKAKWFWIGKMSVGH